MIDEVLLGVVVLESFGFEVDPATGALKERPLLLYPAPTGDERTSPCNGWSELLPLAIVVTRA